MHRGRDEGDSQGRQNRKCEAAKVDPRWPVDGNEKWPALSGCSECTWDEMEVVAMSEIC